MTGTWEKRSKKTYRKREKTEEIMMMNLFSKVARKKTLNKKEQKDMHKSGLKLMLMGSCI